MEKMKVWTGLGFLTPLLLLAGIIAGYFLYIFLEADILGRGVLGLAFPAGIMMSSGINWRIGRFLNGRDFETESLPDGSERVLPKPHTFLSFPMEFWSLLMSIISIAVAYAMWDHNQSMPEGLGEASTSSAPAMKSLLEAPQEGDFLLFEPPAE